MFPAGECDLEGDSTFLGQKREACQRDVLEQPRRCEILGQKEVLVRNPEGRQKKEAEPMGLDWGVEGSGPASGSLGSGLVLSCPTHCLPSTNPSQLMTGRQALLGDARRTSAVLTRG